MMLRAEFGDPGPRVHDTLHLIADAESPVGRDAVALFLDACKRDAEAHDGRVSVSRVSARLPADVTGTKRYASFWSHFTGDGKPMRRVYTGDGSVPLWDFREGSRSRNDGKPTPARRWVG